MKTTWITVTLPEVNSSGWLAVYREAIARDGRALRAAECPGGYTIEMKSLRSREDLSVPGFQPLNTWGPLGWHFGAICFGTSVERDFVLEQLTATQPSTPSLNP